MNQIDLDAAVKAILTLASVPVIGAALTALGRFVVPSARLAWRMQSDLSLHKDLPESRGKAELAERIDRDLNELNERRDPARVRALRQLFLREFWLIYAAIVAYMFAVYITTRTTGSTNHANSTPLIIITVVLAVGASVIFFAGARAAGIARRDRENRLADAASEVEDAAAMAQEASARSWLSALLRRTTPRRQL